MSYRGDERRNGDLENRLQRIEIDIRRMTNAWLDWIGFLTMLQEREQASTPNPVAIAAHTVVVVSLIGAAVALTLTGHDASAVWAAAGVYPAGAGVQAITGRHPRP